VSYDSRNRPTNLRAQAYMVKAGLFMAYDRAVQLAVGHVTYCERESTSARIYAEWLWRTYWRDEP
jgi:hypothetical protein